MTPITDLAPDDGINDPRLAGLMGIRFDEMLARVRAERSGRTFTPERRPRVSSRLAREVAARPRLEVFERIASECALRARPSGSEPADVLVRVLAQVARRAALDLEPALAAVLVAILAGRPRRDDDLRKIQVEVIVAWFAEGWAADA